MLWLESVAAPIYNNEPLFENVSMSLLCLKPKTDLEAFWNLIYHTQDVSLLMSLSPSLKYGLRVIWLNNFLRTRDYKMAQCTSAVDLAIPFLGTFVLGV